MAEPAPDTPRPSRTARITAMAREIARLSDSDGGSPGDLAALRRLDPDSPDAAAFWKLLAKVDAPAMEQGDSVRAWAMIAAGMARMAPYHHDASARPGQVLARIDVAEARLEQALRARDDHVWPAVRHLCALLAQHAEPVDWGVLGGLLLAEARDTPDDDERAEKCRRQIARAYYAARHAAENGPASSQEEPR